MKLLYEFSKRESMTICLFLSFNRKVSYFFGKEVSCAVCVSSPRCPFENTRDEVCSMYLLCFDGYNFLFFSQSKTSLSVAYLRKTAIRFTIVKIDFCFIPVHLILLTEVYIVLLMLLDNRRENLKVKSIFTRR